MKYSTIKDKAVEIRGSLSKLTRYLGLNNEKIRESLLAVCPVCASGTLEIKTGKYGVFKGCSNFPKCHYTEDLKELR